MLAKWGCLNKLIAESESEEVVIQGFPGGVACFEMCAKYCYGIPVTVSPHNVGQLRCGAEFLHMTELTEKSNLIYKLEVFFSSSILHGWKDSIICLKASHALSPLSEDLKVSPYHTIAQSVILITFLMQFQYLERSSSLWYQAFALQITLYYMFECFLLLV